MNDYISRREAIKAIDDLPNCYNGYSDTYDKAFIIGTLEEVPSVDVPERKVGNWKEIDLANYKALCSQCGTWSPIMGRFCPYCGAQMQGSESCGT